MASHHTCVQQFFKPYSPVSPVVEPSPPGQSCACLNQARGQLLVCSTIYRPTHTAVPCGHLICSLWSHLLPFALSNCLKSLTRQGFSGLPIESLWSSMLVNTRDLHTVVVIRGNSYCVFQSYHTSPALGRLSSQKLIVESLSPQLN